MTRITFAVEGCDGCRIAASRSLAPGTSVSPKSPSNWNGPNVMIKNGVAVMNVKSSLTRGLSFRMQIMWDRVNAVPLIVVNYAKTKVGTTVSPSSAATQARAHACWAGTKASKVGFHVNVVPFPTKAVNGMLALGARVWMSPTVATVGGTIPTVKGSLATQTGANC